MYYKEIPQNKYGKWYIALIQSRINNKKIKHQTEAHHVFPVSVFGSNDILVNLTHREHYLAHILLWKCYRLSDDTKAYYSMLNAIRAMGMSNSNNNRIVGKMSSTQYGKFRREWAVCNGELTKQRWQDPEYRANQTKHNQEYWSNEDNKKAQSDKRKAHLADADNRAKMVEANRKLTSTDSWRKQRSAKQKELSSDAEYAKKRVHAMNTEEAKAKSKANQKAAIAAMTPEERKTKYGRKISTEQAKAQSTKIKGRKKIIHPTTGVVKVVPPDTLEDWFAEGYTLKAKSKEL